MLTKLTPCLHQVVREPQVENPFFIVIIFVKQTDSHLFTKLDLLSQNKFSLSHKEFFLSDDNDQIK